MKKLETQIMLFKTFSDTKQFVFATLSPETKITQYGLRTHVSVKKIVKLALKC